MLNNTLSEEFLQGKVLLFNKPLFWTSFDIVNKAKHIFRHQLHMKNIKIGHAGTLDPLATGLVLLCTGKETKNIEKYQSEPKEYLARIKLGATTPSFDLETDINEVYPYEHIQTVDIENVLQRMTGDHMQLPPAFSAKFINGTRAYKLARKGEQPELEPRKITIYSISLTRVDLPIIEIHVRCSKGTYIRSLARDIGILLNSGAHLIGLVRLSIGCFLLKDAMNIEEFEKNLVFLQPN
jgi:tRNA pseudouridine55 synthase